MKRVLLLLAGLLVFSAQAAEFNDDEIRASLEKKVSAVQKIAKSKVIVDAVKAQNSKQFSLDQIKIWDEQWRASADLTDFKRAHQENPAGRLLRRKIESQGYIYSEGFVTDQAGANVAAFPATSDYWQGDEEKFTASFNNGDGKVFIGPVEFDESSKTDAAQISVPIVADKKTIGVLVMGIKLSHAEAVALRSRKN